MSVQDCREILSFSAGGLRAQTEEDEVGLSPSLNFYAFAEVGLHTSQASLIVLARAVRLVRAYEARLRGSGRNRATDHVSSTARPVDVFVDLDALDASSAEHARPLPARRTGMSLDPKEARRKVEAAWAYAKEPGEPAGEQAHIREWPG